MSGRDIFFAGVPGAVRLPDDRPLARALEAFFRLWPHGPRPDGLPALPGATALRPDAAAPLLTVSARGRGYGLRAPWRPELRREPSKTCLLCSLAIDLVESCCRSCPDLLSLHAAAVSLHGRGLIFCGDSHAGKSTLVARLMAEGARGFGDDLPGLYRDRIFSFGVAPRLRLPLPASPALRRLMADAPGIHDRYYGYPDVHTVPQAPWGTLHAPHAIILLERAPGRRARLLPVSRATGLDDVLARFLIPSGGAPRALAQGTRLLETLPCYRFQYDDLDEAAALLLKEAAALPPAPPIPGPSPETARAADMGSGQTGAATTSVEAASDAPRPPCAAAGDSVTMPPLPATTVAQDVPAPPDSATGDTMEAMGMDPDCLWRRCPGTGSRSAGARLFLTDGQGDRIFRLEGIGVVVWQLLEAPLSLREGVELLAGTFPGVPETRIRHELETLFFNLFSARLIEKSPQQP